MHKACEKMFIDYELTVEFGGSKVDILIISETKIEEIFSLSQFKIGSFNSYFDMAGTVVEGLFSYLSGNIYQQSS